MTVQEWLGENNKLGISIWEKKYRQDNETFERWLDRVSGGDPALRKLIVEKKFLMGGRVLTNRGLFNGGSLNNCYSSGYCPDDLVGIFDINTILGLTYKAQGGQGVSLSKLRPKGAPVGTRLTSDGIVPFMELFNQTTESIAQGGGRKGALMMSLDIWHKEAESFITIKTDLNKINKANLSLEIDDEFMEAVNHYYKTGEEKIVHVERMYQGHKVEYDVIPIKLFKLMVKTAYDYGEPGCLFVDELRSYHLMEQVHGYNIETTNPCGEQPLPKHCCCNLGSLNLSEFVTNPYTSDASFNFDEFKCGIQIALVTLDKLIDENKDKHAVAIQADNSLKYRNIGLGVMGYAGCLMKLGLRYGSKEAIELTDKLFDFMFREAVFTDVAMGIKFGAFPAYSEEMWNSTIIRKHFSAEEMDELRKYPFRNCSLLSIAPTGSIGTMLGESGGIEPEFAVDGFNRKTEALDEGSFALDKCKAWREYIQLTGDKTKPDWAIGSSDIHFMDRIETQAVIQSHIDTGISSTINLPQDVSIEDVEKLYFTAWSEGLKGVTIFRTGCKRAPILSVSDGSAKTDGKVEDLTNSIKFDSIIPLSRKEMQNTYGTTYCKKCACGTVYITINCNEQGEIVECFAYPAKNGGCKANIEGLTRLLSAGLRSGIKVEELVDQLKGIQCGACIKTASMGTKIDGISCPDIISRTLQEFYDVNNVEMKGKTEGLKPVEPKATESVQAKVQPLDKFIETRCPECGAEVIFTGGCNSCPECGYSKCN